MIRKDLGGIRSATTKEDQQDILLDEMLRERAAVLARAGFAVEDALAKLSAIDLKIQDQIQCLNALREADGSRRDTADEKVIFEQINLCIDEFNAACRKAELQYYYLIVTREAMGLRRHETVKQFYTVPPKKKKMQGV